MNNFAKLASKLIKNKLWKSDISIKYYTKTKADGNITYTLSSTLNVSGVVSSLNKTMKIPPQALEADIKFVLAKQDISTLPSTSDKISFNNKDYSIIYVYEKGTLNNESAVLEIYAK